MSQHQPPGGNPAPTAKRVPKDQLFAKYILNVAPFLVGHSTQEALEVDSGFWSAYTVIALVAAVCALASWALLDPNDKLKKFGAELGLAVTVAIGTGILGFLIGTGWGFIAISVVVLVTAIAGVIWLRD